jgi:hypothetical protein
VAGKQHISPGALTEAEVAPSRLLNKFPKFPQFAGKIRVRPLSAATKEMVDRTGLIWANFLVLPVRIELTTSPLPREVK